MSKKGSALMQVLVIGLIVATFAIMILRYAVTRSANLSRTARILESDIVADSCMDQYMAFQAAADLSGIPPYSLDMGCAVYKEDDTLDTITMYGTSATDIDNSYMVVTTFTVQVNTEQGS